MKNVYLLLLIGAVCTGCFDDQDTSNGRLLIVTEDASIQDASTNADQALPDVHQLDSGPSVDSGSLDALVDAIIDDDPSLPNLDPEYVMSEVSLLPVDVGFDLDGDGESDNALALLFSDPLVGQALGGDPNEFIARSVRRGDLLLLLDFHALNDFANDRRHDIDIFLGRDTDSRRRNNFNGDAEFYVSCSSVTATGEPESRFNHVKLTAGALEGRGGQFRFLVSFSNTEVLLRNARINGEMSADGLQISNGQIGGAVTYEDLEEVVVNDPEIGPAFARVMLSFIERELDIDLDGDGAPDALSASFRFAAVRAQILRNEACRE